MLFVSSYDRRCSLKTFASADRDLCRRGEGVGRNDEIIRRGPLADAARRIVDRPVAGAEPAVVRTLMAERDAAEMGADADDDQPFGLLHARGVGRRIAQF